MNKHVSLYRCDNRIINDAFDSVVANICLQHEKNDFKSFLLTGCEPGVGTTTICVELAISLSIAGFKTLLLDCDLRKSIKYKRLNDDAVFGLADYVKGSVFEQDIICATNWPELDYIPCGRIENDTPLRMLYSQNMSRFMDRIHQEYDFIIIDVPSINSFVDSHILSVQSDATILIAALDGSSRKYLEDARERLIKDGANVIGVIQNKVAMSAYKSYIKDYDYFNKKRYLKSENDI